MKAGWMGRNSTQILTNILSSILRKQVIGISLAALFVTTLAADNWRQFRGPRSSGVSESGELPARLAADGNLLWRAEVPPGKSSPILTANRIFLTAHDGGQRLVLCLDRATGKVLWTRGVKARSEQRRHVLNGPASPTPVTDGENVYAFFAEFGLIAHDAVGKELWRVPLGPFEHEHGISASPILAGGLLILLVDQISNSHLAGYQPSTGELIWKTERINLIGGYSTPTQYETDSGEGRLIVPGPSELAAYSIDSGKRLWWVNRLSYQPKATPIVSGDTVFFFSGGVDQPGPPVTFEEFAAKFDKNGDRLLTVSDAPFMANTLLALEKRFGNGDEVLTEEEFGPVSEASRGESTVLAIRRGGKGDVTDSRVVWRSKKGLPVVPSPLVYRDILYLVKDGGILTALNPQTGEVIKQGRLKDALDKYYSSPVAGDGKIYFISETGKATVVRAGADWDVLSSGDLGEDTYATPALGAGRVYVRTGKALYCFGAD